MEEISRKMSELLMGRFLHMMCLAAGSKIQVGAQFLWRLSGDLEGDWMMRLMHGNVGIKRASEGEAADAIIRWQLGFDDVTHFLKGRYGFKEALEAGRLTVEAEPPQRLKLARAIRALADADVVSTLEDPEGYFRRQTVEGLGLDEQHEDAKTGVRLRRS